MGDEDSDNEDPVVRTDRGPVATLTLNRPERRNALSLAMLQALGRALDALADDPDVRVIVVAGSGPAFSAGHDLTELRAADTSTAEAIFSTCSDVMLRIATSPKPVIAEVAGVATAAGCQLVASCDLAVAASTARFATPGVNIGLFCSTPAVPLARAIAPKHAMEMLLTGEAIDAHTAWRFGLVNDVVEPDGLDAAVARLADILADKPAQVIAAGKATLRRQVTLGLADAYDVASQAMVDGLAGRDATEGIGAFLDKRKPVWAH